MLDNNKPIFSLTVAEYIELHKEIAKLNSPNSKIKNEEGELKQDDYISIDEACIKYKKPKNTLYGYNSRRLLPYYKFGRNIFYKRSEIEIFFQTNRRGTKTELINASLKEIYRRKRGEK